MAVEQLGKQEQMNSAKHTSRDVRAIVPFRAVPINVHAGRAQIRLAEH